MKRIMIIFLLMSMFNINVLASSEIRMDVTSILHVDDGEEVMIDLSLGSSLGAFMSTLNMDEGMILKSIKCMNDCIVDYNSMTQTMIVYPSSTLSNLSDKITLTFVIEDQITHKHLREFSFKDIHSSDDLGFQTTSYDDVTMMIVVPDLLMDDPLDQDGSKKNEEHDALPPTGYTHERLVMGYLMMLGMMLVLACKTKYGNQV